MIYDADVLLWNTIGPGWDLDFIRHHGIGGSEYEVSQIAHALADRGHKVIIANAIRETAEQDGVTYMPLSDARAMVVRALYIERWSRAPDVQAERTVIRASDVHGPPYDAHLPLLVKRGATLVCVSKWQAKGFLFAKNKIVIPPMLGEVPKAERVPGRFLFASGPGKGLAQTLLKWRQFKAKYRELTSATLTVVTPGRSYDVAPEISPNDRAIGVSYVGSPPLHEYRRYFSTAQGMLYVACFQETFACVTAFTEIAGGRNHVLCLAGKGGMAEAVTNMRLITSNEAEFERDFMAAWRDPENTDWYAQGAIPDRSPAALAPIWEDVLGL